MRRGIRCHARGLLAEQVPAGVALAARLRAESAAEEHERAEIKRLTLRANADLDPAARPGPLSPNLNPNFAPATLGEHAAAGAHEHSAGGRRGRGRGRQGHGRGRPG